MQTNLNKNSCCNFDEFRVTFDKICEAIPVVSTISMTIGAIQKHLYVPEMEVNGSLKDSHYYSHLKEKDFEQKWLLFVPGLNFIVAIVSYFCPEISNVKAEPSYSQITITNEEVDAFFEDIIDDDDDWNEIEEKKAVDERKAKEG